MNDNVIKLNPAVTEQVIPDRTKISAGAKKVRDKFDENDRQRIKKAKKQTNSTATIAMEGFGRFVSPTDI